jgi:hypothetical protein
MDDLVDPSLAASRVLDPGFQWPDSMFPKGHEFRERYRLMELWQDDLRAVAAPREGSLWIDGQVSTRLPRRRAAIVQYTDDSGEVRWTQYHMPDDPVLSYPTVPKTRNTLLVASGIEVALTGVMFGLSYSRKRAFENGDEARTVEEFERLQRGTNTFGTASLVGACASGVSLGLAFVMWKK